MQSYILRRVLYAVLVVWAAFTATFFLLYLLPSDPISVLLDQAAAENGGGSTSGGQSGAGALNAEVIETIKARYGYDKPLLEQYVVSGWRMLTGDLGTSITTGIPVRESLLHALPQTIQVAAIAIVLGLSIGVGVAVLSNLVPFQWLRQVLQSLPPFVASVPTFWLGLIFLQVFSFRLGWFPAYGNASAKSLVLPSITLALPTAAVMAQVLSKSLRDSLASPYVETAKAKGASRLRVHFRHAFRNGVLPSLTMVGLLAGNVVAGSVVIETVFARDGIGRLTQQSVNLQDLPVVLAIVVLSAAVFAVVNLIVDLLYPIVDPRVRRTIAAV